MQTRNEVYFFLQKNMTKCRLFWVFMYTVFFICGWLSFYSTKIWMDIDTYLGMSIYVVMGFIVCCFSFLVIPLAYLIHHVIKENVDRVKLVLGAGVADAIFKFLVTVAFPVFSICIDEVFHDVASMWMCICLVGSLLSLLMCYSNPKDYGISYAFLSLCLGVLVHLQRPLEKCVLLVITMISLKKFEEAERNAEEGEVIKSKASEGLITPVQQLTFSSMRWRKKKGALRSIRWS